MILLIASSTHLNNDFIKLEFSDHYKNSLQTTSILFLVGLIGLSFFILYILISFFLVDCKEIGEVKIENENNNQNNNSIIKNMKKPFRFLSLVSMILITVGVFLDQRNAQLTYTSTPKMDELIKRTNELSKFFNQLPQIKTEKSDASDSIYLIDNKIDNKPLSLNDDKIKKFKDLIKFQTTNLYSFIYNNIVPNNYKHFFKNESFVKNHINIIKNILSSIAFKNNLSTDITEYFVLNSMFRTNKNGFMVVTPNGKINVKRINGVDKIINVKTSGEEILQLKKILIIKNIDGSYSAKIQKQGEEQNIQSFPYEMFLYHHKNLELFVIKKNEMIYVMNFYGQNHQNSFIFDNLNNNDIPTLKAFFENKTINDNKNIPIYIINPFDSMNMQIVTNDSQNKARRESHTLDLILDNKEYNISIGNVLNK